MLETFEETFGVPPRHIADLEIIQIRKDIAYPSQKDGWIEALKWLKDNDDAYCCGDCDEDGWHECPTLTAIKKELGEQDANSF